MVRAGGGASGSYANPCDGLMGRQGPSHSAGFAGAAGLSTVTWEEG
jgi:hypothetical protein